MSRSPVQSLHRFQSIRAAVISGELQTELLRKSIHISVAMVPAVVSVVGTTTTLALLALGTLAYSYAEVVRARGGSVPVISWITEHASRRRDVGGFVLGPVTLGLGAMMALLLYPAPAASVAIFALAFGDGIASVAGKLIGRTRLPLVRDKSLEGSLACFAVVVLATSTVTAEPLPILAIAAAATVLEALPIKDADNLLMPVGVGLTAVLVL